MSRNVAFPADSKCQKNHPASEETAFSCIGFLIEQIAERFHSPFTAESLGEKSDPGRAGDRLVLPQHIPPKRELDDLDLLAAYLRPGKPLPDSFIAKELGVAHPEAMARQLQRSGMVIRHFEEDGKWYLQFDKGAEPIDE